MSEQKQKFLSTLIVSLGAFLGFEALSFIAGIYQVKTYILVSFYVYFFHVFWLTFIFDLHAKKRSVIGAYLSGELSGSLIKQAIKDRLEHVKNWHYIRHFQNFLVLPAIIYWSVVILLFLNPFKEYIKQLIVVSASLAMTVAYWYFKDFLSKKLEMHEFGVKALSLVKLFAAFLIFSATMGVVWYFGMDWSLLALGIFCLTFILIYQSLFQHKLLSLDVYPWLLTISVIVSATSFLIYNFWGLNYLTAGLVILAVYNSLWGMLHHHLEKTLTKKLAFEYLAMLVLVLSFLVASHDFTPRIN